VYYKCPKCQYELVEEACDIISDDLTHRLSRSSYIFQNFRKEIDQSDIKGLISAPVAQKQGREAFYEFYGN
jgi:hypothetical protein